MLFASLSFLSFFLPLVRLGLWLLPGRLRLYWLLLVSLFFYAWGEPAALLLMLLSIGLSFGCALAMTRFPTRRRLWLWLSVGTQLLALGYYKYIGMILPHVQVALPVGISFFTFQAIGYSVDVYRGEEPADRSLARYATFISFYPQLIAGPIERYGDIAPQLREAGLSWPRFATGARLLVIGLGKKLLLANAAGQLWDQLRLSPQQNGWLGNWLGLLAFAFQIYFDFSGYTDMARGLGAMVGIRLRHNFHYPYTASSITDFWRRWHMSLSQWFRDYVYIPLGGNRRGLPRQLLNILIVWALTGLWHGASLNFLFWGLYYAAWLMLDKLLLLRLYHRLPPALKALPHAVTMLAVLFGWGIFAISDLQHMGSYLGALAGGEALSAQSLGLLRGFLPLLAVCALASVPWRWRLPHLAEQWLLCALLLLCVAALVSQGYNPFLYFRF